MAFKMSQEDQEKDHKDTLSTYKITQNVEMISKYIAIGTGAECQRSGRAT